MKRNFENGIPVWGWGILFMLLILVIAFWGLMVSNDGTQSGERNLDANFNPPQTITPLAGQPESDPVQLEKVQPTSTLVPELTPIPLPTVDPDATKPFVIDVSGE